MGCEDVRTCHSDVEEIRPGRTLAGVGVEVEQDGAEDGEEDPPGVRVLCVGDRHPGGGERRAVGGRQVLGGVEVPHGVTHHLTVRHQDQTCGRNMTSVKVKKKQKQVHSHKMCQRGPLVLDFSSILSTTEGCLEKISKQNILRK